VKISTPFYVLAVDPGKATGVAFISCSGADNAKKLWAGEVDEDHFANTIRPTLTWWKETTAEYDLRLHVVYERFLITPQTGKNSQAPFSLEMIGVLKQECRNVGYTVDQIVVQTPADAKAVVSNKQLRAIDFWHRGGAGHANDALRHAVLFMIRAGFKDSRLLST
jgi:hypothetical protein